jgi:hypothetical protein
MGDRQCIEAIQWLAYIGQTRENIHAGNGREVHFNEVSKLKEDGYCRETNEVFEYLGCFWHGCPSCMPNRDKPIGKTKETLANRYKETMARLQKIKDAAYTVVWIWGCEFRKLLSENPGLENELCSHPYLKNSQINIRDALYGGRNEPQKPITGSNRERNPVCGCYQSVSLHL